MISKKIGCFILFCVLAFQHMLSAENSQLGDREKELISHVEDSISKAEKGISKLTKEVLQIKGMSSSKVRHFLNNLNSMPNSAYLEIGCWQGSTWVSGLYGNESTLVSAIAIDDWSLFSGPKQEFARNCAYFLKNNTYQFFSEDCFKLNLGSRFSHPMNVYFYDGGHLEIDQELAFTYYNDVLDDVFVAVVDDWNFKEVPVGTRRAFAKLNYEILFETVLPARWNGDVDNWWNGLYVAVIRKPKAQ